MKKTYSAVTQTGEKIERNSTKEYSHAYAVYWAGELCKSGFSASADKAQKAAENERRIIARIQKTTDLRVEIMTANAA